MHDAYKVVKPRRVAVIGRAGAGKTTVALAIGAGLDLPVVHLDRLYWAPGWRPVPAGRFEARQAHAIAADRWVLDGGYLSSTGWPERVRRADLVLLVEAPLAVCVWRVMHRAWTRTGHRRPDLPDGCEESFGPGFLRWIVTWNARTRAPIREARAIAAPGTIVRVRGVEDALAAVRRVPGPPDG
jgi:adenylate kinase family enzyme